MYVIIWCFSERTSIILALYVKAVNRLAHSMAFLFSEDFFHVIKSTHGFFLVSFLRFFSF